MASVSSNSSTFFSYEIIESERCVSIKNASLPYAWHISIRSLDNLDPDISGVISKLEIIPNGAKANLKVWTRGPLSNLLRILDLPNH